jgi:soluble lytic murein transglycosylase-like protein
MLLGFCTGLAISATLTYQYGNSWYQRLHQQAADTVTAVHTHLPPASASSIPATPSKTSATAATTTASASLLGATASALTGPAPSELASPVPAALPATGVEDETEAAWSAFMAGTDAFTARGEFPWRDCFRRAAASHDVPELLLLAVARGESGFDAAARSHRDAVGVMQIRWPLTAQHLGILSERQLYQPCLNIDAGARYLRELLDRYRGNTHLALAAYNFGPGRVSVEHVPQLAAHYSAYILEQLEAITDPAESFGTAPALPAGRMLLLDFAQAHRARAMIEFLQESEPSLRLDIDASPRGTHAIYLAYADEQEQRRALRAINATGITIAMAGPVRPNQESTAHEL